MTIRWNPVAVVAHNGWSLPRALFHLSHVALGLPVFALALLFHASAIWVVAAAFVVAFADKSVWIRWGAQKWKFALVWSAYDVRAPHDWADFTSDLGLTLLGAFVGVAFTSWIAFAEWWLAFYFLETVNGT